MASTSAIRAARAFVEIGADNSKLMKVLKRSEKRLTAFAGFAAKAGGSLIAGGTAILAPLTAAVFAFADAGDQLDKMAARTGASTNALSEWGFAAEQSGASSEVLEKSFTRLQKNLFDAQAGTKKSVDALKQIGYTWEELKNKSPDEQFELVAGAIGTLENQTIKAGVANDLFGRSGVKLLPLFNQQADGMEALRQEARDLGLSIGPDQAKAAADFTDAWNRIKRSVKAVTFGIGAELAPTLTELQGYVVDYIQIARKWISENGAMIKIAAGLGVGLVAAGVVLLGVAGATMAAAIAVKVLTLGIGLLASVVGFLISPIGLVIAGVVGIGGAILYYSGAGAKALAWLKEKFGELSTFAVATFGAIKKALDAGEYKLAGRILWAALKVVWAEGMAKLADSMSGGKTFFLDVWNGMVDQASKYMIDSWAWLKTKWTELIDWFGSYSEWNMKKTMQITATIQAAYAIGQVEDKYKDAKPGSSEERLKKTAIGFIESGLDMSIARTDGNVDRLTKAREKKTENKLNQIENDRAGSNEVVDEDAVRRQKAREKVVTTAAAKRKKAVDDAKAELEALTIKANNLPDPEETAIVKNAKANSEPQSEFNTTAQRAMSADSVDLKTEAGAKLIADLLNQSQEDEMINVMKDGNGLQVAILDVLKGKLNRPLNLGGGA